MRSAQVERALASAQELAVSADRCEQKAKEASEAGERFRDAPEIQRNCEAAADSYRREASIESQFACFWQERAAVYATGRKYLVHPSAFLLSR